MNEMTDRELLEFVAAQVGKLTTKVDDISNELRLFKSDTDERFNKIDNRLMVIENDHGSKLEALLDGYKQLSEGQEEIKEDIQTLSDKQEKQELEIHVIKGIAK